MTVFNSIYGYRILTPCGLLLALWLPAWQGLAQSRDEVRGELYQATNQWREEQVVLQEQGVLPLIRDARLDEIIQRHVEDKARCGYSYAAGTTANSNAHRSCNGATLTNRKNNYTGNALTGLLSYSENMAVGPGTSRSFDRPVPEAILRPYQSIPNFDTSVPQCADSGPMSFLLLGDLAVCRRPGDRAIVERFSGFITAWDNSPGHHRNMIDHKVNVMGIGYAEGFWSGACSEPAQIRRDSNGTITNPEAAGCRTVGIAGQLFAFISPTERGSYVAGGTTSHFTSNPDIPLDIPVVMVSVPATAQQNEGDTLNLVVTADTTPTAAVTISYTLTAGTATADDYMVASSQLTLSSDTAIIPISIINDTLIEMAEQFTLTLDSTSTDTVEISAAAASTLITINADPRDSLEIALTESPPDFVREGDTAVYPVSLTGGTSTAAVVVSYNIGGTVTPADYIDSNSGRLSIATGENSGELRITLQSDTRTDPNETLLLTLGTPSGGGGPPGSLRTNPRSVSTTITELAIITDVALLSIPRNIMTQAYGIDERITVRVRFSEAVRYTGSPALQLGIGSAPTDAALDTSRSTAAELYFAYTVQAADRDENGLSLAADALQNAGLTDARGIATQHTLDSQHTLTDDNAHQVNGGQAAIAPVDLIGDGNVSMADVRVFYYSFALQTELGDGTDNGNAKVRVQVLDPLTPVLTNDAQLRGMLRAAHALRDNPTLLDLTRDGRVNVTDAAAFYYALALPAALGDGTTGGNRELRAAILGPLAPGGANDTALRGILTRARALLQP